MPEVRIDPLSGLKVLVGSGGGAPPGLLAAAGPVDRANDPFAEGHEDRTGAELHAVRPGGGAADGPGWAVRVVPHPSPLLAPETPEPAPFARPELLAATAARGAHEVIVHAPDPVASLADLAAEQVALAVDVWRARIGHHAPGAAYVHLVVDERGGPGASPSHTHAHVYALGFVPAAVARERERFGAYATQTMGGNLLGDLVQEEVRARERIVAIDDEAVLMAPYASRAPYQLMLVPRAPRARFEAAGPTGALLLHQGLRRLARVLGASPPLSLWVRTAPRGAERFCWRIDVVPRLAPPAGLELGTGVPVNGVAPEDAAAALREAA